MASDFQTAFLEAWTPLSERFGVSATYYAGGTGAGTSVTVIFSDRRKEPAYEGDGEQTVEAGMITCSPDDVSSPSLTDTFVIDSVTYAVREIESFKPLVKLSVVSRSQRYAGGVNLRLERGE